jgi:hypothetical protein
MKKKIVYLFLIFCLTTNFLFAQTNPIITSWLINDSLNKSSAVKSICFSQEQVYVENNIQESKKKCWYAFPLNPDTSSQNKSTSYQSYIGMMIDGSLISSKNSENILTTDSKNKNTDNKSHSSIIGFANDGFPIYGSCGFYNKNGTGEIVRMKSGFHLKSKQKIKDSKKNITDFKAYEFMPSVFPDFLDVHNGRFCITPEYPLGTYCYFLTIDSLSNPVYPFLIGPTLFGSSLSKMVDTIDEPYIKYANLKKETNQSKKDEKLPFTIFFAEKSELIIIQSNGMINEDIKLQLYDASSTLLKETTLYQGSTISYFDAQTLYNGEYTIKIIRSSGTTEQKLLISKSL